MKLADVCIRRPVLTTVLMGVLAVFGVVAYPRIGVDEFPDVEFPFATVTAVYPGADPETIESKVIEKLEEAISTISGIKMMRSTCVENVGFVVVQFELERKADEAVQDVRDKVASALRFLPPDLEPPVVERFDIGSAPIMAVAVAGKEGDLRETTRVAEDVVKARLQTLSGVGGITMVGGRRREFHVWLDPRKLDAYWLTPQDVAQALAAQNVEVPGGRLELGDRELVVKTRGQVLSADELRNIVITAAAGAPVRVGDVARVDDGQEEERSYSSLNGRPAVALVVRKQSGSNSVQVAAAVRQAVEELKGRVPQGITLSIPSDVSVFTRRSIHEVQFDLAYGALLAVVIIFFFLHDGRATFISALALPISVVATFAFIRAMGFTFNNMTMAALSLSIGILIDDAIVVIENIHRHLERGKRALQAAADATREIGLAVMATTASIVAVFVPVGTMKGMIGRFFKQFGLTVAFAVSVSLLVSFTLTPMLASRMLRLAHGRDGTGGEGGSGGNGSGDRGEDGGGRSRGRGPGIGALVDRFLRRIDGGYRRLLAWALAHRGLTVAVAIVVFLASLLLATRTPVEFIPQEDRGQFLVKVELPSGASLEATRRLVTAMDERIRALPGVDSTFVSAGGGTEGEVNRAEIQVNLVPRKERAFSQREAMEHVRAMFAGRRDATVAVEPMQMIGGTGAIRASTIQFNIRGSDHGELNRAAEEIRKAMAELGGYVDVDTSYRGGKPEVAVTIDRDRAADLGVPVAAIAMTIRTLMAGDKVTELATAGDRFDVRVRMDAAYRRRAEDLLGLRVRSTTGALVDLSNVITVTPGTGPARIERQDRQRQVTVFANLQGKVLGDAVKELDAAARTRLPPGLRTDWAGMGQIMGESMGHLMEALVLAVLMIYLILAAQFESFVHPFTIMLSLPLSVVGALGGLLLAGKTISIISMIGIILLMGLVTKNAILLVDYTNTLRRQEGLGVQEALLRAGPVRLRPILMTTAAMIFGMVPVALGLSEGGELRSPMAVAVIGGLLTSTLLTLVVVPVAYSLIESAVARLRGLPTGRVPVTSPPTSENHGVPDHDSRRS